MCVCVCVCVCVFVCMYLHYSNINLFAYFPIFLSIFKVSSKEIKLLFLYSCLILTWRNCPRK